MSGENLWQKLLDSLSQSKYPYVIVGGAALALHGIPRSTLDIDIYVSGENKSLEWFFKFCHKYNMVCKDSGVKKLLNNPKMLVGQWLTFTTKDGIEVIDIFIESDKDFNDIYKNAETIKTPKGKLVIASIDDLLKLKRKSGRDIDKADILLIKKWKLLS